MGAGRRKRQRSMSIQSEDADPLQRLEAFRARMFDLKPEAPSVPAAGDAIPAVQWKSSKKSKHKRSKQTLQGAVVDEGDAVPSVKFAKRKSDKKQGAPMARKVAMPAVGIVKAASAVQAGVSAAPKPAPVAAAPVLKKKKKKKLAPTFDTPARPFIENENPLADLTKSLKEKMAAEDKRDSNKSKRAALAKVLVKSSTSEPKTKKLKTKNKPEPVTETPAVAENNTIAAEDCEDHANLGETTSTESNGEPQPSVVAAQKENTADGKDVPVSTTPPLSKSAKKRIKRKARKLSNVGDNDPAANSTEAATPSCGSQLQVVGTKSAAEQVVSSSATDGTSKSKNPDKQQSTLSNSSKVSAPTKKVVSTKDIGPIKKNPSTKEATTMKKTETLVNKTSSKASQVNSALTREVVHPKRPLPSVVKAKVTGNSRDHSDFSDESENDSDEDIRTGHFRGDSSELDKPLVVSDMSDTEMSGSDESSSSDEEDESLISPQHQRLLFSGLIDEAARNQWELQEVGRLVRLFSGLGWSNGSHETARFLRHYCPELVSAEFLDGLEVKLSSKQLIDIFDRGSGTPEVFVTKIASAVENGYLSAKDAIVAKSLTSKMSKLTDPSTRGTLVFLMPLLESLSNVREFGGLMRRICRHWQPERAAALVQQILLTSVFDDLEGEQDDVLAFLPQLKGLLDFPSRIANEDADENGNLIGLIASDDEDAKQSDEDNDEDDPEAALGEILSEDEEDDSEHEDEEYEGETDSEEEREIARRYSSKPRKRSRFILDEASEDEEEEEDDTHGWEELAGSNDDNDDDL